jgi:O-acetylserine/cysteine efflux transporter
MRPRVKFRRKSRRRALVYPTAALVFAAGLWGTAATGTKYALGGMGPLTLLAVELVAATIMLWSVLLVRGYRAPSSWRLVTVLGLLEPALAYLGDTFGLSRTGASDAAVLTGLEAGFVVVLGLVILRERMNRNACVAVAAGLTGLVILEHDSWLTGPGLGDALILGGVLSAALYTIVAQRIDEDADALTVTAHQFAVATSAILPLAVLSWATGQEAFPADVPAHFWVVAVLVGMAGFGVSFALYNHAVPMVSVASAAVIINLIPAFGLSSAILLLGERLTPARVAGAVVITASVVTFMRTGAKPKPNDRLAKRRRTTPPAWRAAR